LVRAILALGMGDYAVHWARSAVSSLVCED